MPLCRPALDTEVIALPQRAMFPDPARIRQAVEAYRRDPAQQVFGWTEAGQLVCAAGLRVTGDEAELLHIGTHPQHSGQGHGRSLLRAVAQELHLSGMWAQTDDSAAPFYRRSGFRCQEIPPRWGTRRYRCEWRPQCSGT